MATKRDLVEAHSFSRRRLVTAFVSGAPGGREVEPVRPGRSLVGGIALSVLLLAGALIASIFSPRVPADWQEPGLIVSKDKQTLFVITDDGDPVVLHYVINPTSGLLIAGAGEEPRQVPQELIDDQVRGEDLGILGAPSTVPSSSLLISSGWTACTTGSTGIRVTVGADPAVSREPSGALVVRDRASGDYYVVAHEADAGGDPTTVRSYALPGQGAARDKMLSTLGLPVGAEAVEVASPWLALMPTGGELGWESAEIEGAGDPVDYADDTYPGARVGDLLEVGDSAFVLEAGGPAPLTEFAAAVYRNLPPPRTPRVRTMDQLPDHPFVAPPFDDARWPEGGLTPVAGESCVQLVAEAGSPPYAALVGAPGEGVSSAGVTADRRLVTVDPGRGALVASGDWGRSTGESLFLVDAQGRAYPLDGADTPSLLGYGDVAVPLVPDSWVALFDEGVVLSQEAALCPPDPQGGSTCQ